MTEEKEIEKSESSHVTFNDADKIVEDTLGFKKECIIEAEGNLPEDAVPESVIKPTEITVEKTEEDVTDISTEEIIDNSMKKEDIDKIDAEAKKYLEKHSKEAEIDWDKIEFEDEEKNFPKISKEELDVFCTISEGFIDRESVETYIRIAHADIENYLEMKQLVDSGEATEDDKDYYDSLSKSKENSRIILATIQQDGRKLDKEFKESRIAEDLIKAVTLKACSDYIVKKYRLNNSWRSSSDERHNIDNTKFIRDELLNKMYIAPLFHNIIERDKIKSEVSLKYNLFGSKFYNSHLDDFTESVRVYIRQGKLDFDKLTIEKVLSSDMKTFEFMRLPMVWALKQFNASIQSVKEWEMTPEEEEKISSRMNPNNLFDTELKELAKWVDDTIDLLLKPSVTENGMKLAMDIIQKDPFTKKIAVDPNYDWSNSEKVMMDIAELIPENVTKQNFSEWSVIYKYLQKYERYFLFYKLDTTNKSNEFDSDKKRVNTFNVLCGLVEDYYMFMVGELITSMNSFLYESGYNGETQNIMFSTVMSNLICQHELGYRQKLITEGEEQNVSGEGLYNLAEDLLKDKFTYIIGNKNDDILLKNVNLIETRRTYIKDCTELIQFIYYNLSDIMNGAEHIIKECDFVPKINNKYSKKKSRRNRR